MQLENEFNVNNDDVCHDTLLFKVIYTFYLMSAVKSNRCVCQYCQRYQTNCCAKNNCTFIHFRHQLNLDEKKEEVVCTYFIVPRFFTFLNRSQMCHSNYSYKVSFASKQRGDKNSTLTSTTYIHTHIIEMIEQTVSYSFPFSFDC